MTLIEVVAGIALLSFLLVASLVGAQRHDRQLRTAKAKSVAVAGTDELLSSWRQQGVFRGNERGAFTRDGYAFVWETRVAPVESLPLNKLRLEVRLVNDRDELVTVELLIPPRREVQP